MKIINDKSSSNCSGETWIYQVSVQDVKTFGGYPLLEWVLIRLSRAKSIDKVVLATSDLSKDDELLAIADNLGISVFRGSETNVLDRFSRAALHHKADVVVRVCADNPFVDHEEIDRLVNFYFSTTCDYACNHQERLGNQYADGFGAEILSNALLQKIADNASDLRHREHVTLYLWENSNEFLLSTVTPPKELAFPGLRLMLTHLMILSISQL